MYLKSPERSSWVVGRSPGTPALGGEEEVRAAEEQERKLGRGARHLLFRPTRQEL
jgi:hypothetical protein